MMIIGSERNDEIEKLNLSNSLKKLTRGEYVHEDLVFRCESIKYSIESEDFSPEGLDVIPLWESEFSITGFYLKKGNPIFITYDIDDINSPKTIGESVQELIDYLVSEYGENEAELKSALSL